jgi:flagellar FliJ protein
VAKFVFKLESVLSLKRQTEDNLKNELGKAVHFLEMQKQALQNLYNEKKRSMDELKEETQKGGFTVPKIQNFNAYISSIEQKISKQIEKVNFAKENVDKYRGELVQIMKERKILESLREKQFAEYLKEEERQQQQMIDEKNSYKESRKKY